MEHVSEEDLNSRGACQLGAPPTGATGSPGLPQQQKEKIGNGIHKFTFCHTNCQIPVDIIIAVLEIMVSIQTLSDHFGILPDSKRFGSDI